MLSGVTAGVLAWLGTLTQGTSLSFPRVAEAGLNIVPPAIFLFGIGALGLVLRPRLGATAVYVVLGWSALVQLAGGLYTQDHQVLDTSVFHQIASAPDVAPDWRSAGMLAALGSLAMILAGCAFRHRDLQGS